MTHLYTNLKICTGQKFWYKIFQLLSALSIKFYLSRYQHKNEHVGVEAGQVFMETPVTLNNRYTSH